MYICMHVGIYYICVCIHIYARKHVCMYLYAYLSYFLKLFLDGLSLPIVKTIIPDAFLKIQPKKKKVSF